MSADYNGLSALILAAVGVFGAITAWLLNRRGQEQQAIQQEAANDLAERAQGFTEMKSIVAELRTELTRIAEAKERELASQARRCHSAFDHFILAFTTLQGQVVAETAKRAADAELLAIEQHNAEDHPPREN
jgi:ABC-type multidrug transport system fused ATPase/permease subunit